jgi:hypothetical protein
MESPMHASFTQHREYIKSSVSIVNYFLKNATDKETTDTEIVNRMCKLQLVQGKSYY